MSASVTLEPMSLKDTARFMSKVEMVTESGCWIWMGDGINNGYGAMAVNNRMRLAHRLSYSTFVGPIQAGLYVCHRCDTPLCVNPHHMFLGDQRANIKDASMKGRMLRGEDVAGAKLTEEDVRYIRSQKRGSGLAEKYGVDFGLIYKIRRGEIWKHVK